MAWKEDETASRHVRELASHEKVSLECAHVTREVSQNDPQIDPQDHQIESLAHPELVESLENVEQHSADDAEHECLWQMMPQLAAQLQLPRADNGCWSELPQLVFLCCGCMEPIAQESAVYMRNDRTFCSQECRRRCTKRQWPVYPQLKVSRSELLHLVRKCQADGKADFSILFRQHVEMMMEKEDVRLRLDSRGSASRSESASSSLATSAEESGRSGPAHLLSEHLVGPGWTEQLSRLGWWIVDRVLERVVSKTCDQMLRTSRSTGWTEATLCSTLGATPLGSTSFAATFGEGGGLARGSSVHRLLGYSPEVDAFAREETEWNWERPTSASSQALLQISADSSRRPSLAQSEAGGVVEEDRAGDGRSHALLKPTAEGSESNGCPDDSIQWGVMYGVAHRVKSLGSMGFSVFLHRELSGRALARDEVVGEVCERNAGGAPGGGLPAQPPWQVWSASGPLVGDDGKVEDMGTTVHMS